MWILVYEDEDNEYVLFSQKGFNTEEEAQKDADNYNEMFEDFNVFPLELI